MLNLDQFARDIRNDLALDQDIKDILAYCVSETLRARRGMKNMQRENNNLKEEIARLEKRLGKNRK